MEKKYQSYEMLLARSLSAMGPRAVYFGWPCQGTQEGQVARSRELGNSKQMCLPVPLPVRTTVEW